MYVIYTQYVHVHMLSFWLDYPAQIIFDSRIYNFLN